MSNAKTFDRVEMLASGYDDAFDEFRERVPEDDELALMDDAEIEEMAGEIPLLGGGMPSGPTDVSRLRKNLRRLRDGGIPMECHRCENRWVYGGRSVFSAQCGNCKTSVTLKTPEGEPLHEHYGDDE